MREIDACFWLHGWSEINGGAAPSALQWQIIVDHVNLVRGPQGDSRAQPDQAAILAEISERHATALRAQLDGVTTRATVITTPTDASLITAISGQLAYQLNSKPSHWDSTHPLWNVTGC